MIPEISVTEAAAVLERDPSAVYLDVRTEQEFAAAHPRRAYNVPAFFLDAAHRSIRNPDFESVVEASFAKARTILCACQAGVRSYHAAEMLRARGFTDVRNVAGGFGGSMFAPGWRDAGLPVESGNDVERGYAALKARR